MKWLNAKYLVWISAISIHSAFAYTHLKLKVVTEEWVPYNYTAENGAIVGIATQRVKAVLDSVGIQYQIESYPWIRSMRIAQSRPQTMIYSIYWTKERSPKFHWVCPLFVPVKEYFYRLSSRTDIVINNIDDAKKYTVATVLDTINHKDLLALGFSENENLDITATAESLQKKLLAGRVDLLLASENTMEQSIRALGMPANIVTAEYEHTARKNRTACMALNLETDPKLIEQIQLELDRYNGKHGVLER